jgi:hypothetical protein
VIHVSGLSGQLDGVPFRACSELRIIVRKIFMRYSFQRITFPNCILVLHCGNFGFTGIKRIEFESGNKHPMISDRCFYVCALFDQGMIGDLEHRFSIMFRPITKCILKRIFILFWICSKLRNCGSSRDAILDSGEPYDHLNDRLNPQSSERQKVYEPSLDLRRIWIAYGAPSGNPMPLRLNGHQRLANVELWPDITHE